MSSLTALRLERGRLTRAGRLAWQLIGITLAVMLAGWVAGTVAGWAGAFLAVPVATVAADGLAQAEEHECPDGKRPAVRSRAET